MPKVTQVDGIQITGKRPCLVWDRSKHSAWHIVGMVDGVVLDGSFPSRLSVIYTPLLLSVIWGLPVEAGTLGGKDSYALAFLVSLNQP